MGLGKSKIAILFAVISFISSWVLIVGIGKGNDQLKFDEIASGWIGKIFNQSTVPFFEEFTELGSKVGVGVVAIVFIFWLWRKKRDYIGIATFVLAIALGNEVSKLIKDFVGRPRPVSATGEEIASLSFPSGHAMVGLILYMLIAYFLVKAMSSIGLKWLIVVVCGIVIILLGVSRIVLVAHHPSDVVGGFLLGYLWTYLFIVLYEVFKGKAKS